jgi:TPR repeat protein
MTSIGVLYARGWGVQKDDAKAREWYEKAAAKNETIAMFNLGGFYESGRGIPQDYDKAREWYEKAAANGDTDSMVNVGLLYAKGLGVPHDPEKAREWYEKGAALGSERAKLRLRKLPAEEAEAAERYGDALKIWVALAEEIEQDETKRTGAPGKDTADALVPVAWDALLARDFTSALSASERAHKLSPDDLIIETNRAHALLFLGRTGEARALYLTYKTKPTSPNGGKLWDAAIADDFVELRKAGLAHPLMPEIQQRLGGAR